MIIKTSYICGKCGKQFDNYEAALECEMAHYEPEWCTDVTFKSLRYEKGERFPGSLIMRFEKVDDYDKKAYALYRFVKGYTEEEAEALEKAATEKGE